MRLVLSISKEGTYNRKYIDIKSQGLTYYREAGKGMRLKKEQVPCLQTRAYAQRAMNTSTPFQTLRVMHVKRLAQQTVP